MKTLDSNILHQVTDVFQSDLGKLYFFNHIAVVEFNEGVHVTIESTSELLYELVNHFGTIRPFGLVANRVNSYSISPIDSEQIKSKLDNLVAYGVVSSSWAGEMNCEIENDFCKSADIHYKSLYEALVGVFSKVKEELLLTLD